MKRICLALCAILITLSLMPMTACGSGNVVVTIQKSGSPQVQTSQPPEHTHTPIGHETEEKQVHARQEAVSAVNQEEVPGPESPYKLPLDETGGMPFQDTFAQDPMTYDDPTIHVERFRLFNQETRYNCMIHYAKVKIADASQLRTASCRGFDNRSVARVDVIGRQVNAVLAVNGDFFGSHRDGYILRQGTVYRDRIERKCDLLLIDEDGDFHIIYYDEDQENIDKTQWNGKKVVNVFTFGPALIVNDEVVLNEFADPAHADAPGKGARTCIVQTGHLEYMVITCRELGVSLQDMVSLVQDLTEHVVCAYMLDGGFSSQLAFMGRLVNKIADDHARPVTDIVYFASAWPGDTAE